MRGFFWPVSWVSEELFNGKCLQLRAAPLGAWYCGAVESTLSSVPHSLAPRLCEASQQQTEKYRKLPMHKMKMGKI